MKRRMIIDSNNVFAKLWNYCWNIYYKNEEVWNYLIIGGITTLIAIGSKLLFLHTFLDQTNGIELQISEVLSFMLAILFAYIANKKIVFKTKGNIREEITKFISGRLLTQGMQMFVMFIFVTLLKLDTDFYVVLFTLICQVLQIILNYIISAFFVFKKNTNDN